MTEHLPRNASGDQIALWTQYVNIPSIVNDQVHSGLTSTKWTAIAAGTGGLGLPVPGTIDFLARRLDYSLWLRTTRAQNISVYFRQGPLGFAWYQDVIGTITMPANVWTKVSLAAAGQVPHPVSGELATRMFLYLITGAAVIGDQWWVDTTSIVDDINELAVKTWNGVAWVPRRMRRF